MTYVEVPRKDLFQALSHCGFLPIDKERGEIVFARSHACPDMLIKVYTTCTDLTVARGRGEDAIRIVLGERLNAQSAFRGVKKMKRVFRAGTVEGVIERAVQRMRAAYAFANMIVKVGPCVVCGGRCYPDSKRCITHECANVRGGRAK